MLEEVDRLTRLVDTLLLIARSDGGALVLARTDIDLGELAGEAITALAVLAEEKNLRTTIVSPTPVVVSGDRTMLRQVLVNLLHNAIRHSPMGASITIECGIAGEHAQCSVLDHGPGIPAEHRGRVFERFYRVDDARTQASGGTGLGLALALSIVEMHGGTIELVDRSGPGTLFRFGLPRLAP
jgi:signal transduction histidine kinase